uniref:ABC transmembrane type-1 domain-containing protein n=1 Tax=Panagrolaimus sp. ES5 TaxID=591445 RepID=A0AC34GHH6_9BILA
MDLKDARLKLMTDVLSGVKVLKLYAWEESMRARIAEIRTKEVTQLKYAVYCYSAMEISFNACPILATIVSFIGYIVIQGHPLTPQVAFLSLMLFNLMRFSVYRIPGLVQEVVNAKVSLNRVQEFLLEPEVPEMINTMSPTSEDTVIEFKNANFSWSPIKPEETTTTTLPTLKSLNFEIKEGELIGIIGRVGAGKSSILSAICGELYQSSGQFYRKPAITVAYVPQEAWIQNLPLRDNILFGKIYDEKMY